MNDSRMNRKGPNALVSVTLVDFDCMQYVAGLGSPIGHKSFVISTLKVHIVKINITHSVTSRTQHHDTCWRRLNESRQQISSQQEMSEVINSELLLKPINSVSERRRHNSSIQNQTMKWNVARHELGSRRTHRLQ